MADDALLNQFISQGTNAERLLFTPTPPTPIAGPEVGYYWFETDTGDTYSWNTGSAAWVKIAEATSVNAITALTGDVTATGPGSVAATIANNAVTTAKILDDNVTLAKIANAAANSRLLGSGDAGVGINYVEIVLGSGLTMTGTTLSASGLGGTVTTTGAPANGNLTQFSGATSITNGNLSGDVTTTDTLVTTIANNAITTVKILDANVTLAKIANAAANDKLLGSGNAGAGAAYTEITIGSGLTMTGTTLSSSGGIGGSTGATDNAILRADGVGGSTLQNSALTIDDTGIIGFPDDVRQTFNPGANAAGLNVGSLAGDPGTPSNGDLWYDSTANELTARINGANVALGAGGTSSITINAQTGTTYTVLSSDQGKLVTFSNASSIAVTLPQATGSFGAGFFWYAQNIGAGVVTITPTTSTINGAATLRLPKGGSALIISDGTNYRLVSTWGFYAGLTAVGGLSLQIPDATTTGGNARGATAVDLQITRSNANQVASGDNSFVVGENNRATGTGSAAIGSGNVATGIYGFAGGNGNTASNTGATAFGVGNVASNTYAFAMGTGITASAAGATAFGSTYTNAGQYSLSFGAFHATLGNFSFTGGDFGDGTSNLNQYTFGCGKAGTSNAGEHQARRNVLACRTSGSAAVRFTADLNAAGATNSATLADNTSFAFEVSIVIRDTVTGNTNTYTLGPSLVTRGAGVATTAMSAGNPAVTAGPTTGTALTLAAAPTVTADTTNGAINISFTPPVANTNLIRATAEIWGVETR